MIDPLFGLGAPPIKQECPKTQRAGDLSKPNPLPGVTVPDDPEKDPEIKPVERTTVGKVVIWAGVAYAVGKLFGIW